MNGSSQPSIRIGTGSPEGVVSAPQGSLFLRQDGSNRTTLYIKEQGSAGNTGWTSQSPEATTTTQLATIGHAINTTGKFLGKEVWNSTLARPVWATGATAAATWVYADGTTAHTPA